MQRLSCIFPHAISVDVCNNTPHFPQSLWPNQSNAIAPLLSTISCCLTPGIPRHCKELFGTKTDFIVMIFAKFIFDMFYYFKQTLVYTAFVRCVYNLQCINVYFIIILICCLMVLLNKIWIKTACILHLDVGNYQMLFRIQT